MLTDFSSEYNSKTLTKNHVFPRIKLLISDVRCILSYISSYSIDVTSAPSNIVVVYAGAAPGVHIPALVDLFPFISEFVLYDPVSIHNSDVQFNFHPSIRCTGSKIRVVEEYFTDLVAKKLCDSAGKDILFISDIRTESAPQSPETPLPSSPSRGRRRHSWKDKKPKQKDQEDSFEDYVVRDMMDQWLWISLLNPKVAMLKFRIPYSFSSTVSSASNSGDLMLYQDGVLLNQVYKKSLSGESRLLVLPQHIGKCRTYSVSQYSKACYDYNVNQRNASDEKLIKSVFDEYDSKVGSKIGTKDLLQRKCLELGLKF